MWKGDFHSNDILASGFVKRFIVEERRICYKCFDLNIIVLIFIKDF